MPMTKKQRNVYWYSYVIGMVVFYEIVMLMVDHPVNAFLIAFGGIAAITFGFVIFMRRASRPAPASGMSLPPRPERPNAAADSVDG
jgi:hypothetical protein